MGKDREKKRGDKESKITRKQRRKRESGRKNRECIMADMHQ